MNSDKLKKVAELLEYGGGRFLVVEDGEPAFVVLDVNEFKKINEAKQSSETVLLKKINDDIEMWKEEEWDDEGFDEERMNTTDMHRGTADAEQMFADHGYDDEDDGIVVEDIDNEEEEDDDDYISEEEKRAIIQSATKEHHEQVDLEGIPF